MKTHLILYKLNTIVLYIFNLYTILLDWLDIIFSILFKKLPTFENVTSHTGVVVSFRRRYFPGWLLVFVVATIIILVVVVDYAIIL